ncbi:hypothetical protein GCM10023066_31660 [Nocardioides kongjuensis]
MRDVCRPETLHSVAPCRARNAESAMPTSCQPTPSVDRRAACAVAYQDIPDAVRFVVPGVVVSPRDAGLRAL